MENYLLRNNFQLKDIRAMTSYEVHMHFRILNSFKEVEFELSNPEKKKSADDILGINRKGGPSKKIIKKKFDPEVNDFI